MSGIEVLCHRSPGETRLLARDADGPLGICLERESAPPLSGSIRLGRVTRLAGNLGAAFIDIGEERPGFLPHADAAEGQSMLVQIQSEPVEAKGARLTASPVLTGGLLVYTPRRPGLSCSRRLGKERENLKARLAPALREGEGVILRSGAASASDESLLAELEWLRGQWAEISARAASARAPFVLFAHSGPAVPFLCSLSGIERIAVNDAACLERLRAALPPGLASRLSHEPGMADEPLSAAIEAALDIRVPLPSGGSLLVEEGRTLTAIDVNSGGDPSPQAQANANLEAAAEIPRQLRLRNPAGRILIDFIAGARARPEAALARLKAGLAHDPVPCHLLGASPSGLAELSRERRGAALSSLLCKERGEAELSPESQALAALRRAAGWARQGGPPRMKMLAGPGMVSLIRNDLSAALAEAEAILGGPLAMLAEPGRSFADWEIVSA